MRELANSYDICAVSSIRKELEKFGQDEGVRTKYIDMSRPISLWRDLKSLIRLILFFISERPDIVHGNTPKASLLSMTAAWLTCRPIRIYMCHGLRYQGTSGNMRSLLMLMEKITCRCATHVICVSEGVKNQFTHDNICEAKKMNVIGFGSACGVDLNYYDSHKDYDDVRAKLNIPNDGFIFTFVGRVVQDKGINELTHAFVRLTDEFKKCFLIIVGPDESEQNRISDESKQIINNCPQIFAVGQQADIRPYLAASNALVLPSYREGFGMVLVEAGAMGVPSITTNIIGCNEVIIDGTNGSIIEPRDEDALLEQMRKWLLNPALVDQYAKKAREMVEKRYEQKAVWRAYRSFYESVATFKT